MSTPTTPTGEPESKPSSTIRETRGLILRTIARARLGVEHDATADAVYENGGITGRYLMMTVISASIAALGLMLNSPAVVIGAMLVSPMMGPIVALGFSLALLDFAELKQSLGAIVVGVGVALFVAVLLVLLSPLKEPTAEIIARTRPNFFDLLIAVFSGVAGAYAVIRQRGDTIIGVAIATALMPPVVTVGFGIGTADWHIAGGAFFLFMTNLVAIALAATVTAGFYGFHPRLLERPAPWRGIAVIVAFLLLAIPLGFSLRAIALESRATAETRLAVEQIFADYDSRITQLEARADGKQVNVWTLVSTRQMVADAQTRLQDRLTAALHVPVNVKVDQLVVADPSASRSIAPSPTIDPRNALARRLADAVPFDTQGVLLDAEGGKAVIPLSASTGLDLKAAYALEAALRQRFEGVDVRVIPPLSPLDAVPLADRSARQRALWAMHRWQASPTISLCQPQEITLEARENEEAATTDRGKVFLEELSAAGIVVRPSPRSQCENGDTDLARIRLLP
ncbi:DUF389 domain-containing protein [uncultured Brevundimonas sp.]|uniref:DUF389 domain-containing protein n=1 Tax=uncultured Brevundimonas sp. TaxID=213418 RepID=UPI002613E7D2|nr:DUF389 domain-containing protein [uncultured Brevundimonas sp.]